MTTRLAVARTFGNDDLGEASRRFNIFMDKLQEILRGVAAHTHQLTSASRQLPEAGEQITANSGETAVQSNSASKATQQVTQNWQSLSTGAGEMTATVQSIAANPNEAAKVPAQRSDNPVQRSGWSSKSSPQSRNRPTCWLSMPRSKRRGPVKPGRALPWWPTKCRNWRTRRPRPPKTSAAKLQGSRRTPKAQSLRLER
jgi:hypothetical protein